MSQNNEEIVQQINAIIDDATLDWNHVALIGLSTLKSIREALSHRPEEEAVAWGFFAKDVGGELRFMAQESSNKRDQAAP